MDYYIYVIVAAVILKITIICCVYACRASRRNTLLAQCREPGHRGNVAIIVEQRQTQRVFSDRAPIVNFEEVPQPVYPSHCPQPACPPAGAVAPPAYEVAQHPPGLNPPGYDQVVKNQAAYDMAQKTLGLNPPTYDRV